MEKGVISVENLELSLEEMESVYEAFDNCHLTGCDTQVSDNLFPTSACLGKFKLITVDGSMSSDDVLNFFKEKDLKASDLPHLLALAKKFPKIGNNPIIALGVVVKGDKSDGVPAIWRSCPVDNRSIHLFKLKDHCWTPGTQFLAQA